jgi:two-component system response regulator DevR
LLAEGFSNKEIADRLFLADQTVRNYVHRVLSKLGLKNRVQLAVLAARRSRDWQEGGSPTDVSRAL